MELHPEAIRLAGAFIKDFYSANHTIKWLELETEKLLWLSPQTVLVGKCDAIGVAEDGQRFFGDWKTASKNKAGSGKWAAAKRAALKSSWRMSPQALTYGLLNSSDTRQFTVRWVFKTEPATTDFEWYTYTQPELEWWKQELLDIAEAIRHARRDLQWGTNLNHCTRYGEDYRCPFRDEGCWALNFKYTPLNAKPKLQSHLQIENDLKQKMEANLKENPLLDLSALVVLDASRVGDWLGCHQYYKRVWEDGLEMDSEALTIGTDFHQLISTHLGQIKSKQQEESKCR